MNKPAEPWDTSPLGDSSLRSFLSPPLMDYIHALGCSVQTVAAISYPHSVASAVWRPHASQRRTGRNLARSRKLDFIPNAIWYPRSPRSMPDSRMWWMTRPASPRSC